jgi:branched-chain amino acid transport system permease protein
VDKIISISIFVLAIVFIVVAQNFFSPYYQNLLNLFAIYIIFAVSYNLINGVTGQFSLEPNGFVAIGAYITALSLLTLDDKIYQFALEEATPFVLLMETNLPIALLCSGIVASAVAFCLAFPVFRVRGDYLAIVTLGFGFIIQIFAVNFPQVTNGAMGFTDIGKSMGIKANLYITGTLCVLSVLFILNVIKSKYGRAMKAIRDDEDAALAMGINTFKNKTSAFCTSAFFEGVGGGLLAVFLTTISPDQFSFLFTFQLLIIIVLGGLGSTTGAILGTILVLGGSEFLVFLDKPMDIFGYETPALPGLKMVVFSIILICVMLFARRGIMGDMELGGVLKKLLCRKRDA